MTNQEKINNIQPTTRYFQCETHVDKHGSVTGTEIVEHRGVVEERQIGPVNMVIN